MVEIETSQKLACLHFERGGKYLSQEFMTFCLRNGIRRQLTVPHTPQQNGVAERKNRHLCETMRTLLFEAKLRTYLWEEAVRTTNYVANRMPHRALKATTPLEQFSNKKPDISHL